MSVCERCRGEGHFMLGFCMTECNLCNQGEQNVAPALDKINRKDKSYQKAIKDIMEINPEISRKDAVKMFDEAYVKG